MSCEWPKNNFQILRFRSSATAVRRTRRAASTRRAGPTPETTFPTSERRRLVRRQRHRRLRRHRRRRQRQNCKSLSLTARKRSRSATSWFVTPTRGTSTVSFGSSELLDLEVRVLLPASKLSFSNASARTTWRSCTETFWKWASGQSLRGIAGEGVRAVPATAATKTSWRVWMCGNHHNHNSSSNSHSSSNNCSSCSQTEGSRTMESGTLFGTLIVMGLLTSKLRTRGDKIPVPRPRRFWWTRRSRRKSPSLRKN